MPWNVGWNRRKIRRPKKFLRAILQKLEALNPGRYYKQTIHPGYRFLSENQEFARKCKENDIFFVGPDYETIQKMGYKTAARNIAKQVGVPIIPWTEFPLKDKQEALEWC